MNIKAKRGEFKGRLLLVITIILISLWLVSGLNESSTTEIGILPVEETAASTEAPISIMPTEPPTQESPTSAAISIQPLPSDENQDVPVEEPAVTIPEVPVEEATLPEINSSEEVIITPEPAPSLLSTFLNLVLDKVKFFVGEVIEIQATLTDQNSNPLPDKKIDFYADEQIIGTNLTDSEGTARVAWNTSSWLPGAYSIRADYAGDETSEPVSATRAVILEGEKITEPEAIVPENIAIFTGEMPKFPFLDRDSNVPINYSLRRPELIKNNLELINTTILLEEKGYLVHFMVFGIDKNSYYILAAKIETKDKNYDAEAKEVFEVLYNSGFADYYGVEIYNMPEDQFVDYKVSRATLQEFLSNKLTEETFRAEAEAQIKVLPPPADPNFPNKR